MKTEYLKFIAGLSKKYYKKFGNIWWYSLLHEKNTNKTMTYHNLVLGNKPKKFSIITALLLGVKKYSSFWYRHFLYRRTKEPKNNKIFFITYGRYRGHFEPFEYSDGTWIYLPQKGGGDESLKNETAIDYFVDIIDLTVLGFVYIFYVIKNIFLVKELSRDFRAGWVGGDGKFEHPYFKEEIYRSFFGDVLVEGLFYECAFGNMFKLNLVKDKVIYIHEGQGWEKMMLLNSKSNRRQVTTIGLLCSCPSLNETQFWYDEEEVKILPIPDKLGVLGEYTYNTFYKMYSNKVFINGPMRYRYIDLISVNNFSNNRKHVLVLLPPFVEFAIEILDWVKQEKDRRWLNIPIVVKLHPSMEEELCYDFSNWCSVLYNKVSAAYLEQALCVVSASPSMCIEAMAYGAELVIPTVKSFTNISSIDSSYTFNKNNYFDFSKDERRLLR